ncbi:MAG: hypothetical protein JW888_01265 [Pirellulales bacterium]|nr:hypothetical protein [Pirellulales bacterium]
MSHVLQIDRYRFNHEDRWEGVAISVCLAGTYPIRTVAHLEPLVKDPPHEIVRRWWFPRSDKARITAIILLSPNTPIAGPLGKSLIFLEKGQTRKTPAADTRDSVQGGYIAA